MTATPVDTSTRQQLSTPGYVESDGMRISFRRIGVGRPLLMVHGWGADALTNWVETGWVEALEQHRELILIDVRGHGLSSKPHLRELYSYAAMSNDVLAVMNALDIEACDFMGYSMGAFMGAWLLGHHRTRFTAMVLGGIGNESQASAALGAVIAEALRNPARTATDATTTAVREFVASIEDNDLEALACAAEQMWPEGYPAELAGTNVSAAHLPVLIVNGERDHPYVDTADDFVAVLPNATHVRIPGTDHLTTVSSDRFKRAVLEFLTKFD